MSLQYTDPNREMTAPEARVQPEAYYLQKGTYVPNNRLPALVYRDVLPRPLSRESTKRLCENNHWERRVSCLASRQTRPFIDEE